MKKIIIFSFVVVTLLFTFTPSVQAKQEFLNLPIPAWFSQAIQPIQDAVDTLIGKTDNHEARIAELEKKNASLEEKVNGLEKQLSNQNNLLINLFNGEAITIPSGSTGIGATDPTSHLDLNCGSSCQDLLHIP